MFASDAARLFEAMGSPAVTGDAVDTFRHWVNSKVLPAIFATGGYILNPDFISSAMVSDMDRMPLPAEAGAMLITLAQDPSPYRYAAEDSSYDTAFEPLLPDCPLSDCDPETAVRPAYDETFFQRVRALGDHPAVRDLNAQVDAVVLPALFAYPDAIDRLPAILAADARARDATLDI